MIHAREKDFDAVKDIFKQHKEWFPHLRQDYIKRMIASGNLILENEDIKQYRLNGEDYIFLTNSLSLRKCYTK